MRGRVVDISTNGEVTVKVKADVIKLARQKVTDAEVTFIDGRVLSDKQRKMCYALLNAIADYTGESRNRTKGFFKLNFWKDNIDALGEEVFSLKNAPMSLIASFQKYLIEFILDNDIPTNKPLIECVDDVEHYIYMCLIKKRCAVCGRKAQLHHHDTVGMGNDREEIIHEGKEVLPLCAVHHSEAHTKGKEFLELYHLIPIKADKAICKVYKLRSSK